MDDERPDHAKTPLVALGVYANMVEEADVEIGVTLAVSGAWVSGLLTSTRRYLDAMTSAVAAQSNDVAAQSDDEAGRDFAEGLTAGLEGTAAALLARPAEDRRHGAEVYLRRARLWLPAQPIDELVMVVRIDRVDAFWVGIPFTMPVER
jgi:hypothetical protein